MVKFRWLMDTPGNLDHILQLVFLSGNLVQSVTKNYGSLTLTVTREFLLHSKQEQQHLLTHLLDLIHVCSSEKCYFVQDPVHPNQFNLVFGVCR